jgi:ABC-2 type transport system permease protein
MSRFSLARLFAMLRKESLQMRRDRATVGLTVMLPLIQLFLVGYHQRQSASLADGPDRG